jgi:hypothetical protein
MGVQPEESRTCHFWRVFSSGNGPAGKGPNFFFFFFLGGGGGGQAEEKMYEKSRLAVCGNKFYSSPGKVWAWYDFEGAKGKGVIAFKETGRKFLKVLVGIVLWEVGVLFMVSLDRYEVCSRAGSELFFILINISYFNF